MHGPLSVARLLNCLFQVQYGFTLICLEHTGNGCYQRAGKYLGGTAREWLIIHCAWLPPIFKKSHIVGFDTELEFPNQKDMCACFVLFFSIFFFFIFLPPLTADDSEQRSRYRRCFMCLWSTVMLTVDSLGININPHLGVCLMLLALWCDIQLMYGNEFCLQVAHLYEWLYFYIYVFKRKAYMKQEGESLNTDIYWHPFDPFECKSF